MDGAEIGVGVRETKSAGSGTWTTSITYAVGAGRLRSGTTISFEPHGNHGNGGGIEMRVSATTLPPLEVTFIPIATPNGRGDVPDPEAYMEAIRDFWPVADYRASVGRELYVESFTPREAAQELSRRWYREADADEFYHGIYLFSGGLCGYALSSTPIAVSASIDSIWPGDPCPNIHAHELGHNFGLLHADCGVPGGIDPQYPYPNAGIGPRRGYLFSERHFVEPRSDYYDIMSYCRPHFVSDYHYDKAFSHLARLSGPLVASQAGRSDSESPEGGVRIHAPPVDNAASAPASAERVVVLTGVVDAKGRFWGLEAGLADKPALATPSGGAFTLSVRDQHDVEIHTQPLTVHRDMDGQMSVWGTRFATRGVPRFVVIRDANGGLVVDEEIRVDQLAAAED